MPDIEQVMNIRVGDIMTTNVKTVDENDTVRKVSNIMKDSEVGCVLVLRSGKVIGIITERDIVRRVIAEGKNPDEVLARDIMSSPIVAVLDEAPLADAALLMAQKHIRRLVVINREGKLIGVVTARDLAKYIAFQLKYENMIFNALAKVSPPPSTIYE